MYCVDAAIIFRMIISAISLFMLKLKVTCSADLEFRFLSLPSQTTVRILNFRGRSSWEFCRLEALRFL